MCKDFIVIEQDLVAAQYKYRAEIRWWTVLGLCPMAIRKSACNKRMLKRTHVYFVDERGIPPHQGDNNLLKGQLCNTHYRCNLLERNLTLPS